MKTLAVPKVGDLVIYRKDQSVYRVEEGPTKGGDYVLKSTIGDIIFAPRKDFILL